MDCRGVWPGRTITLSGLGTTGLAEVSERRSESLGGRTVSEEPAAWWAGRGRMPLLVVGMVGGVGEMLVRSLLLTRSLDVVEPSREPVLELTLWGFGS